jgi:alanine dehydrogenase
MTAEMTGVAALILITICVGVASYVAGYLIAGVKANKKILKISQLALKEIENTHKTYIEYFTNSSQSFPHKVKGPSLKIIRSDDDKGTPSNK